MKNFGWQFYNSSFAMILLCVCLTACMAPPTTLPEDSLIDYKRSGSFIGRTQHLQILTDGSATLEMNQTQTDFTISQDEVDALIELLQVANFKNIRASNSSASADLIEYTIIYDGKRIKMIDTMIPESLYPVIDKLNQIVANR